jgi:hypothetical protein
MFATLNQRWLIVLRERETRALKSVDDKPQHQNWLQRLLHRCKQLT